MEKFNITNKTMRSLSNLVKEEIKVNGNVELGVFYKCESMYEDGKFFIADASQKHELELKGNVVYNFFCHNKEDGKITLNEIESKIFGVNR